MITILEKAAAIAQIKHNVPLEEIAENLTLPVPILKEWKTGLDLKDTIAMESNIHAVARIAENQLVPLNEDLLKNTLELTAIDLAAMASLPAKDGDVIAAQALKLCAEAVAKLYTTIVLKGGIVVNVTDSDIGGSLSSFESLMKD